MSTPPPLVSVILVCKNPGPSLEAAVDGVLAQVGTTIELVVIDGASTDGSAEWLESRRSVFSELLSEPDGGVYEAMNKGLRRVRGHWVLFLGADDRLASNSTLLEMAPFLTSAAQVVVGNASFSDGRVYSLRPIEEAVRRNFCHHQATFYRRITIHDQEGFDTSYRIMGDYDLNLRLLRSGAKFKAAPVQVAICGSGGLSDSGSWRGYREEITIRHRYFPFLRCLPWDFGSVVRFWRKKRMVARR